MALLVREVKNFCQKELAYVPPAKLVDPDNGEEMDDPDAVPDYLVGVNKLMRAWEEMNGRTALDKRGRIAPGLLHGPDSESWRTSE